MMMIMILNDFLILLLMMQDKLYKHVQAHSGSPDLLDSIVQAFGNSAHVSENHSSQQHSGGRSAANPPLTPFNEKCVCYLDLNQCTS